MPESNFPDYISFFSDNDLKYIVSPYSMYLLGRSPEFKVAYNYKLNLFGVFHGTTCLTYCFETSLDDTLKTLLD